MRMSTPILDINRLAMVTVERLAGILLTLPLIGSVAAFASTPPQTIAAAAPTGERPPLPLKNLNIILLRADGGPLSESANRTIRVCCGRISGGHERRWS